MDRLRKQGPTLRFLQKAPASVQRSIIKKASPELVRCICDCAFNILKGNVQISPCHKRKLSKHKTKLRQLTNRRVSIKKKQKSIQTGGFLSVLLSALAPVLGGIIGGLTK